MDDNTTCYRCACGTDENDDWRIRILIKGQQIICGRCDDNWWEDDDVWDAENNDDDETDDETDDEIDDDLMRRWVMKTRIHPVAE
jgi:hypothetical protein